jgi:hypothetical protein
MSSKKSKLPVGVGFGWGQKLPDSSRLTLMALGGELKLQATRKGQPEVNAAADLTWATPEIGKWVFGEYLSRVATLYRAKTIGDPEGYVDVDSSVKHVIQERIAKYPWKSLLGTYCAKSKPHAVCKTYKSMQKSLTKKVTSAKKAAKREVAREAAERRREAARERAEARREAARERRSRRKSGGSCRMFYLGRGCGVLSGSRECTSNARAQRRYNSRCFFSSSWGGSCSCP